MASRFIDAIRKGQRQLAQRALIELAQQKGLLNSDQVDSLTINPSGDVNSLVQQGHLSKDQAKTLHDESVYVDIMATVNDAEAPEEVQLARVDSRRRVGRYVMVSEIGAGGMGVVWKGWDTQLSRWVAIKQLKVNDANLVNRFIREASLLAQLSHANITSVFEIGVHFGMPYLVMQLIDGGPPKLGIHTRKRAAEIVMHAARAVQHAHEHGMVHRDLKPSNLLVSSDGQVFVTDFGLARMRESENDLTASGTLLGTPAYMASEQAQGREADQRTDVYGLGACLYGLVKGEAPFTGEVVHELVKRVALSNPPVLEGNDDLAVITQKAMERDREDRYETAAELADELERFLADEPIAARPLNTLQRSFRRAKRNPRKTAAFGFGALALSAVLIWGGTQLYQDYLRQNQVDAASVFIANAKGQEDQLSQLSSIGKVDPDIQQTIVNRLRDAAKQAAELAPGLAQAEYYLGRAAMFSDDFVSAQMHFDAALEDDPFHEAARVQRIVTYAALEDATSPEIIQDRTGFHIAPAKDSEARRATLAKIESERALIHPDSQQMNLVDAVIKNIRGEFAASVDALNQHLLDFPIDYNIRGMLLFALIAKKDYDSATQLAREMIERDVFVADSYAALAYSAAGVGDYDSAITLMERVVTLENTPDNRKWLATWHMELGDLETAIDIFQSILAEHPDHVGSILGRVMLIGLVYPLDGPEIAHLLPETKSIAEQYPEDAYIHFVLGQTALMAEPETAIQAYTRAYTLDPEEYEAHGKAMISTIHFQRSEYVNATKNMQEALRLMPEMTSWRLTLARYHWFTGDYTASLAELAPLIELGSEDAMYLAVQNHVSLKDGPWVVRLSRELIKINPSNPNYLMLLADGLAMTGDIEGAKQTLDEAARLAADDTALQESIANLRQWLGL
ncbi:MAG: protein kinase [Pseudomonadota bacterium]